MQIYCVDYPNIADENLYPETIGVLKKLKEHTIRLGIVSHRPLNTTRKSLEKHGVGQYFQCVVSPEIANAKGGKVSSEMWRFVLKKMKVKSSMFLHVDDNVEWVAGAKNIGIETLLIDRKNKYNSVTDFRVIHDLTEVLEFI